MSSLRPSRPLLAPALLILSFVASGCCMTEKVWSPKTIRPHPVEVEQALVFEDGKVVVTLIYSNGDRRDVDLTVDRAFTSHKRLPQTARGASRR